MQETVTLTKEEYQELLTYKNFVDDNGLSFKFMMYLDVLEQVQKHNKNLVKPD
jgi:hypothetical protein